MSTKESSHKLDVKVGKEHSTAKKKRELLLYLFTSDEYDDDDAFALYFVVYTYVLLNSHHNHHRQHSHPYKYTRRVRGNKNNYSNNRMCNFC